MLEKLISKGLIPEVVLLPWQRVPGVFYFRNEADAHCPQPVRACFSAILILKIPYKFLRKFTNKLPRKPYCLVPVGSSFLQLRQIPSQNENCWLIGACRINIFWIN